jgi:N-acetyl-anhydromuramyl-L-alanine amidase AmpD
VPEGANPNAYLISIEHAGTPLSESFMNEAQYESSVALQRWLIASYDIPIDSDHLVGHYRFDHINRANCPGPRFPWSRLLADLEGSSQTMADIDVVRAQLAAMTGERDQLQGMFADSQQQLAYVQALKTQVEDSLNRQLAALQQRVDALVAERDRALARAQDLDGRGDALEARVRALHDLAQQALAV